MYNKSYDINITVFFLTPQADRCRSRQEYRRAHKASKWAERLAIVSFRIAIIFYLIVATTLIGWTFVAIVIGIDAVHEDT